MQLTTGMQHVEQVDQQVGQHAGKHGFEVKAELF